MQSNNQQIEQTGDMPEESSIVDMDASAARTMQSILTSAPDKLENEWWSGVIYANGKNTYIQPP